MLSQYLTKYVDQQRSLGFKFRVQQILLRGYVSFAEERGDRHIRSARVLAWAARAPSPEQRRNRLLTVRRFALAMHAENPRHQVPAADALGHAVVKRRPPYRDRTIASRCGGTPAGRFDQTDHVCNALRPAHRYRHADRGSIGTADRRCDCRWARRHRPSSRRAGCCRFTQQLG